jgi:hypothetical protein
VCLEENKYLHENDRLEVGTMATTHMMNTIKEAARRPNNPPAPLLLDIYKIYQKLAKQWPGKEKDLVGPLRELYARHRRQLAPAGDWEKVPPEEILKFCAQELSRQKAALNLKKKMASAGARSAAQLPMLTTFQQPTAAAMTPHQQSAAAASMSQQQSAAASTAQQSAAAGISPTELSNLRTHMLTYVGKFERFNADLSSVSNNRPPSVVADMVGLSPWADQPREVTTLVQNLTALSPPQLTQLGLSSTELGHILAFARHLSSVDLAPIHLLVANQKKYEADTTRKILAANRAGGVFSPRTVIAGLPPVKQTVAFKAKHASSPDAVKKFLQKAAKKQTLATSSPSAGEQNVAKYSQLLGTTGVTITKPGQPTASNLPRPATAGTTGAAAVVSVSEKSSTVGSHQGLTISKKFPHLTISSVDQTNKMMSSSASSTGGASASAASAPKAAPSSRPLAVKAFASLHADSTNISAGPNIQQPGGKVPSVAASNSRGSPVLTTGGGQSQGATASNRSPAGLLGQSSGGKSQGANAAGISRSPMGKPQPAAVAWKAQANSPKTGVLGKASQQQGTKNAMGGSHSLVALRDFKAQVRVRSWAV